MCAAAIVYLGYLAWWGPRGYQTLQTNRRILAQQQADLTAIKTEHRKVERRITLLKQEDPDMIQELARTVLNDGAPGQVAVPRQNNGK